MKIHLNEVFNTYEVTECDRKFGNEITLDGETLISLDKVKQTVEEIGDLPVECSTLIDGEKVLAILDKLIESES
jgi:hypothetical protein